MIGSPDAAPGRAMTGWYWARPLRYVNVPEARAKPWPPPWGRSVGELVVGQPQRHGDQVLELGRSSGRQVDRAPPLRGGRAASSRIAEGPAVGQHVRPSPADARRERVARDHEQRVSSGRGNLPDAVEAADVDRIGHPPR